MCITFSLCIVLSYLSLGIIARLINIRSTLKVLLSVKRSLYSKYQMHYVPAKSKYLWHTHQTLEAMKYIYFGQETMPHYFPTFIGGDGLAANKIEING